MKKRWEHKLLVLVALLALFDMLGIASLQERARLCRLDDQTITRDSFRAQQLNPELIAYLHSCKNPGETAGLFLLETNLGYASFRGTYSESRFRQIRQFWAASDFYETYVSNCSSIWEDVKYFPVPESTEEDSLTVSFSDTWYKERTFGGKRNHEGTDIMASENEPGLYPVLSMTDGEITRIGWLPQGGYRVGVTAPRGAYFYYAHLDSYADIHEGMQVKAGDILGFMGDTGYGAEGTRGKFPVHLHVGIYLVKNGEEISVNPYWILKYLEKYKLKCAFS